MTKYLALPLAALPFPGIDPVILSIGPVAIHWYGVGYVAQQHPEGRITFIDLETGAPETLTGFELADRVVDGDEP